jgi:hypothetical protein
MKLIFILSSGEKKEEEKNSFYCLYVLITWRSRSTSECKRCFRALVADFLYWFPSLYLGKI